MICRLMLQAERRGPEPRYNPLPALVNVVGSCSSTCAGRDARRQRELIRADKLQG